MVQDNIRGGHIFLCIIMCIVGPFYIAKLSDRITKKIKDSRVKI